MEEIKVTKVSSLFPVLVEFGESIKGLAYIDIVNRMVYGADSVRFSKEGEEEILKFIKIPVVIIPSEVYDSVEQKKNIDYSRRDAINASRRT